MNPKTRRKMPRGTILNSQGKTITANPAPSGGTSFGWRQNRINSAREYLNPLRGLTLSRAVMLAEDYQLGRMADLQWTYFFVEGTDPDMIALLALRVGRIVEMDYNLSPEEGADKKLIEEQTDYLTEMLSGIDNLYQGIEHMALAPFRGFAHAEMIENADGDITHFEIVDQWNLVRDGMRGPWKYNPTAQTVDYGALAGEPLPMDRFLYREVPRPINRYALLKFIKSNLSEKDWDAFNEIYNVPGGVVIGPPDVAEEDEAEYEAAAQDVAMGGSGYLPHGSTYVPNEMPHDPATFKQRLDHLTAKLVLAGTGGKLTMLTESGSGTLAGGAHSEVFDRISAADAMLISECVNKQIIASRLEAKFPGQDQVVYFSLAAQEETNAAAAVEQVSKLSLAGYQVAPEQVTQKTGWVVTLKPTPAAPDLTGGLSDFAKVANRRRILNTALAAAKEARFQAHALADLTEADRARLAPLQAQADAVAAAKSPAEYRAALLKLQGALPGLEKQILNGRPDLEQAFEQVLSTAFLNGAAEAANSAITALPVSSPLPGSQKPS
jgi:phage gp29-like protein